MTEPNKKTTLDWRRFLQTESGIQGMLFVREKTPSIHKGQADEMIFEAGIVEGYKRAIDTISEVIAVEQKRDIDVDNP